MSDYKTKSLTMKSTSVAMEVLSIVMASTLAPTAKLNPCTVTKRCSTSFLKMSTTMALTTPSTTRLALNTYQTSNKEEVASYYPPVKEAPSSSINRTEAMPSKTRSTLPTSTAQAYLTSNSQIDRTTEALTVAKAVLNL